MSILSTFLKNLRKVTEAYESGVLRCVSQFKKDF